MIINFEERSLNSPFVDAVWRGQTQSAGFRIAPAGGCWAMLVERRGKKAQLSVVGPMKKALPMYYAEGVEFLVIKFKPGTFMPHLPARNFLDAVVNLPEVAGKSFWLNGSAWQFPDYENAETFVDGLVRNNLLIREPVVDAVLQNHPQAISSRSVQRRFCMPPV